MPRMPFKARMNWATAIGLGNGIVLGVIPIMCDATIVSTNVLATYVMFATCVTAFSYTTLQEINR